MKRFGIVGGGLLVIAAFILFGTQLPSCSTPEKTAKLMKLADIGLAIAQSQGVISPGDSLLIGNVFTIVTSNDSKEAKLIGLAEIGLKEAVQDGVLNPGDTVLIKDAIDVLVTPPADAAAATVLDSLASELAKPPAADLTSGK